MTGWLPSSSYKATFLQTGRCCPKNRHVNAMTWANRRLAQALQAAPTLSPSSASPTDPVDGRTPASWQRAPKATDVYWADQVVVATP